FEYLGDPSLKLHFDFSGDFTNHSPTNVVLDVSGNGNNGLQMSPTNWIAGTNGVFGTVGGLWVTNGILPDLGQTNEIIPISGYMAVTNLVGLSGSLTNMTTSVWLRFNQNTLPDYMYALSCGDSYDSNTMLDKTATNGWDIAKAGSSA